MLQTEAEMPGIMLYSKNIKSSMTINSKEYNLITFAKVVKEYISSMTLWF